MMLLQLLQSNQREASLKQGLGNLCLLWGKVLVRSCQPSLLSAYRKEQEKYCLVPKTTHMLLLLRKSISETAHP